MVAMMDRCVRPEEDEDDDLAEVHAHAHARVSWLPALPH